MSISNDENSYTTEWTYMTWFGFFIQWHINLCGLFIAKTIIVEEL